MRLDRPSPFYKPVGKTFRNPKLTGVPIEISDVVRHKVMDQVLKYSIGNITPIQEQLRAQS